MAYLGNKNGPRESAILNRLGAAYFGCTLEGLEEDISHHQYAEARGEVVPVHVDESARPYIEFKDPHHSDPQRYFVDGLVGDIKTFSDDEQIRWRRRSQLKAEE